jgi:spore coat polysaccharide biosynthesis protein SpsF
MTASAREPSEGARIGVIILARLDSSRLPGKALADVSGRPLLWYIASRLIGKATFPVILATSERPVDDRLAQVAEGFGLLVFRGPLEDVAARFLAAADTYGLDAAFRANGDSPFVELSLLRDAARLYQERDVDLVTNLRPRTHPYGVSVELVRISALRSCMEKTSNRDDREHVTSALYRMLPAERIASIVEAGQPADGPQTRVRLTVDNAGDLAAFRAFVQSRREDWLDVGYREALASGFFGRATDA